jgi:hypothetical protein
MESLYEKNVEDFIDALYDVLHRLTDKTNFIILLH